MRRFRVLLLGLCLALCFPGVGFCRDAATDAATPVDYSKDANWVLRAKTATKPVDVFFVHPTTYGPPANGRYVASLDNKAVNADTDATVGWITGVFSGSCNVFAPRYRQVNIEVMRMSEKDKLRYLETGVRDIAAAFDYYMRHLNGGRPFILASHSQGSNVLQLILLRHPETIDRNRLVAAYMPGWTFTDADIARIGIPLSSGPDATGVLAVWNTIGPGGTSPTLGPGARCVNPLSWTTDHKEYPASMNIAARISRTGATPLVVPHFTAARITDSGALEIPAPRPEIASQLNMSLGAGCYHRYDYDFFYDNVAANVKARCAAYLARHN